MSALAQGTRLAPSTAVQSRFLWFAYASLLLLRFENLPLATLILPEVTVIFLPGQRLVSLLWRLRKHL